MSQVNFKPQDQEMLPRTQFVRMRTHTWHNHDPGNEKKESMFQVGPI
jgi:hypothetical protein